MAITIDLVHATGNQFNRALLAGLHKTQCLRRFHTTLGFSSQEQGSLHLWDGLFRRAFARRTFDLPSELIDSAPLREAVRLLSQKIGWKVMTRHETGVASVDAVFRALDRKVARQVQDAKAAVVYAYEDGALETFRAAERRGVPRFYDLPIAYWQTSRRILDEEAQRLPEWEPTLVGTRDSAEKLARKDEELRLASGIVVPSQFVARSLPASVSHVPVLVSEFGSPSPHVRVRGLRGGPLRVLFAGSMSQRKGLADVFEAMRMLARPDVELVVMGSPVCEMEFYRRQYPRFTYEPTRPHEAVLALMETCDVLVLPSLIEGRALVQQEALACGLPIIVTANAGGEDLIEEGRTGFLVPIRSPETIAERIAWFADHRKELEEMRPLCQAKAAEYTWEAYSSRIIEFMRTVLG